eukprot:TRINITY_DN38299_c0_g1_i1.p1 TRINITY_DN38299_c0_g1~~TRINITY_DN38299_c0_g1_i1.p1  ORF type:complete len:253 (+),score=24.14 TRINITY_DN38299_c0_g1_i1:60-818(+)
MGQESSQLEPCNSRGASDGVIANGAAPNAAKYSEEVPIYAEDGVTAIGLIGERGPLGASVERSSHVQIPSACTVPLFVGPGPQAAPVRRLAPQMGAFETGPEEAEPVLVVRNLTSKRLTISCLLGSKASLVTVNPGCMAKTVIESSSVWVWESFGGGASEACCHLDGLPAPGACGVHAPRPRVILKEVGSIICAALEYVDVPVDCGQSQRSQDATTDLARHPEKNAEWERRLQDALAAGDEEAARTALEYLS